MPRHLPALFAFAERFPDLPLVINHAAKPDIAQNRLTHWYEDIARLATLPQVCCKLSGLVTEAATNWKRADVQPYIDHIIDVFGPKRVLWGSDWPVLNLASDYGEWLRLCVAALAHLKEEERRAVFGLNAQAFYRIESTPDGS